VTVVVVCQDFGQVIGPTRNLRVRPVPAFGFGQVPQKNLQVRLRDDSANCSGCFCLNSFDRSGCCVWLLRLVSHAVSATHSADSSVCAAVACSVAAGVRGRCAGVWQCVCADVARIGSLYSDAVHLRVSVHAFRCGGASAGNRAGDGRGSGGIVDGSLRFSGFSAAGCRPHPDGAGPFKIEGRFHE